jgi:hypothetical protein
MRVLGILFLVVGLFACGSPDRDGDGYGADVDCNDDNAAVHPDADELCDGVDNDCNGTIDDEALDATMRYLDTDGDGFGDPDQGLAVCEQADDRVDDATDCDDTNADIHPDATEQYYDDIDQNCDGLSDFDADLDGFDSTDHGGDDCDDQDDATYPDAEELCDGIDNNCDGELEAATLILNINEGQTDVRLQVVLRADFLAPEPGANLTLTTGGTAVAGTAQWEGDTLTFTPELLLTASTDYEAVWTHACGPTTRSFRTGAYETPVRPVDLLGRVYHGDLKDADWLKPVGLTDLALQYLDDNLLLSVMAADDAQIQFLGAQTDGLDSTDQKPCAVAGPLPVANFVENPTVIWSAASASFSVRTSDLTDSAMALEDVELSGQFKADGSAIRSVSVTGLLDTRPLVIQLGDPDADDDVICELLAAFSTNCETCADGKDLCVAFAFENLRLDEITASVTEDLDPCARSECSDTCEDGVPDGCRCDVSAGPALPVWTLMGLLWLVRRRGE